MITNYNISQGATSQYGSCLSGHTSPTSAVNPSSDTGINTFTLHTSPAASTANDIPDNTESHINSTTDVDPSPKAFANQYTSDQTSAPDSSSTPNTNTQAGQDTSPDAGMHSHPYPQQMPNGYPYMPYPYFYPMPNYYPSMNVGPFPYQGSPQPSFMYNNRNIPTGLNPFIPSDLFYCSSVGLFNSWIHTLVQHLTASGLQDLVPDEYGSTIRPPTPEESRGLVNLFFAYVPPQSYPDWITACFKKQMQPYDVICEAMTHDVKRSNVDNVIDSLRTLSYNGSYPAYQYTSRIHEMLANLDPRDLSTHDTQLKKHILKTLHGSYESIAKKYLLSDSPYTISDIFTAIQKEYKYYHDDSTLVYPPISNPSPLYKTSAGKNFTFKKSNKTIDNKKPIVSTNKSSLTSDSNKSRTKTTRTKSKKVSQVKTHHTTSPTTQSTSIDPTMLRPVPTSLNTNHYMLLDTGATVTLVNHPTMLHNLRPSNTNSIHITSCSNTPIPYDQEGELILTTLNGKHISIHAFYTPSIDHSILSTHDLRSHRLFLNERTNTIEDFDGSVAANIISYDGLHWLSNRHIVFPTTANHQAVNALKAKFPLDFIHRILGHVNVQSIYKSIKNKTFENISLDDVDWSNLSNFQCEDCMKGKSHKRPHIVGSRLQYQEVFQPFQYMHSDLFGPVTVATKPEWFISFTDEASKFKWTYLLKKKDDATIVHILKSFIATIERQFNTKILKFQFDRGTEYTNHAVKTFLSENGIQIVYTDAGDSQAHGVAERLNLTLLNDCRTLMTSARLPHHLWYYAVQYATIIRNSIYSNSLKASPRSTVGLLGLDAKSILPFGQPVIVNLNKPLSKLHIRGDKGFALVPDSESYGYLIYIPSKRRVVSSSNYVAIRQDTEINNDDEYDDSIFDNLINSFISDHENLNSAREPFEKENNRSSLTENQDNTSPSTTVEKDSELTDNLLIQNDAEADLNIQPPLHATENPTEQTPADTTSLDKDEPVTPIDINDSSQLPLIPVDDSTTTPNKIISTSNSPISASSEPPSSTATSSSTLSTTDSSSKLKPLNAQQFYANNSTLGGRQLSNESRKERQKREREERSKARIGKRRKTTQVYTVNYVAATHHTVNQINVDTNHHGSLNYSQAITYNKDDIERKKFQEAYDKEISQLLKMNTWSTKAIDANKVDKAKIINSMFIFTVKRDGRHKCRLVARGDQQKPSTYQQDLVSNTVHHYALMSCLSLALQENYDIIQLDISSAYLYAPLQEELYIRSPPHLGLKNMVHRLNKSLYGLKQSGANWYKEITNYLVNACYLNYVPGWSCVFVKKINDSVLILCLFVDDMVIMTNNRQMANDIIDKLQFQFETKIVNEGKEDVNTYDILGLQIEYAKGSTMKMNMSKALEEKLPNLNIDLNVARKVPGTPNEFVKDRELVSTEIEYKNKVKWLQRVIGLASYVAYKYRYDILYYVNTLARHTLYPSKQVISLTKQLIQFLWTTRYKQLVWKKTSNNTTNNLVAITDAAFANQYDMKSQFGNIYYLNGNIIGARSSKSTITCTSSTESEIYSICEAIPRLKNLTVLIKAISDKNITCTILTDSQTSLYQIKAKDISKIKNKFYGTKVLRVAEEIENHSVSVKYINTQNNTADILTKPLSVKIFTNLTQSWIY